MKRSIHWLVADRAIDPKVDPSHCQFCHQAIGQEHKEGCMARERTVVMMVGAQVVISVPEHWTEDDAVGALSGTTTCGNVALTAMAIALDALVDAKKCACGVVHARFIREATEDDEDRYGIRVNELSS